MEYCKLQICCMLIILYIIFVYYKERYRLHQKSKSRLFEALLWLSVVTLSFDGITAYTVNHLDSINGTLNRILHMCFLVSIDTFIFLLFIYVLSITAGIPKKKSKTVMVCIPFVMNILLVVINMPTLEYRQGIISNYSMGFSAYTCFVMAAVYILLSVALIIAKWKHLEKNKAVSILTYLLALGGVTAFQMIFPQALISSIATTIIVVGVYINRENPAMRELFHYHKEMVMGFATLVENKDGSTGGHIKRTTKYVQLIADELQSKGYYRDVLTKDYIRNLSKAAPMHDIGKISVPDAVLQKPGRLTDEEFEIMKTHTVSGGKIILDTFGHLGQAQYNEMAYEVARHHHEKWNGKGYPDGLKGEEIPLCARIMAIADVFDAISEDRCYRKAMPLEQCFQIIEEGSGRDFDPLLVEVFLSIKDKVQEAHLS